MANIDVSRRCLITGGALSLAGLGLVGCDRISTAPTFTRFAGSVEKLTLGAQRSLMVGQPLAREYEAHQLSPVFKSNGTSMPSGNAYQALVDSGFTDWQLKVYGQVARPMQLTLAQLKTLPVRTQITRHDCVEGWSAIGKWSGPQLARVLSAAGLGPNARYVVFHCADDLDDSKDGTGIYYESIDLVDAFHPQTILAHTMNDQPLAVPHGAPVRLRVERQLGYKQAKYVMAIEVTDNLASFGKGKGGYWEDRGYAWYAGI